MAKANINLPDGTRIMIDGSVDEIKGIIAKYYPESTAKSPAGNRSVSQKAGTIKKVRKGTQQYILELQENDFFKSKRNINDVQKELEKEGHILPTNELSTPLRRLVASKYLRRLLEKGTWVYVNR